MDTLLIDVIASTLIISVIVPALVITLIMSTLLIAIIVAVVSGTVGSVTAAVSTRARASIECLERATEAGLTQRKAHRICSRRRR